MTIPVFRHNQAHDDWEVASVYFSDDCSSFGRSVCGEPARPAGSFDDPTLRSRDQLYDGRPPVRYSVPQQQSQNYLPVAPAHTRRDARYVPGKQSNFVVPPPGVIFPSTERLPLAQDTYWPRPPGQITSASDRLLIDATLAEPPPPTLLLSPSSPPHASASLIKLPMPQPMASSGPGPNINGHPSPLMGPPPRYQEVAAGNPPRLTEAGCYQTHICSPPRRSGHDIYKSGMPQRGGPSREEMEPEGRPVFGSYGSGDRPDLQGEYSGRVGRAEMRERRPSLWRRFVKRFGPTRGLT